MSKFSEHDEFEEGDEEFKDTGSSITIEDQSCDFTSEGSMTGTPLSLQFDQSDRMRDGEEDETHRVYTKSLAERIRRQYSTTSTIFAANIITNPHSGEIFLCLASVIQARICDDETLSVQPKPLFLDFDIIPDLSPELGGPMTSISEELLDQESAGDDLLRGKIVNGITPTIDTIYRYLNLIYQTAKYSPECNIIALIYINRMSSLSGILLTMVNWRALWLISVILAQKVWDDKPFKTSKFSDFITSFTKPLLRKMERSALELLNYLLGVKPSLYVQYYFDLRELFTEISGPKHGDWSLGQLTTVQYKRLEVRSYMADKRAVTLEDVTRRESTPFVIRQCP